MHLDKEYRYVSEQVSHHPPISACYAESPLWHYYGEVDAQNKFMGKSFEIRPTGVAHADLALPEDWAPSYPKAKGRSQQGKVIEHYSWKKVTTNISGFIMGSPTIDHYGDMKVGYVGSSCWRSLMRYRLSTIGQATNAFLPSSREAGEDGMPSRYLVLCSTPAAVFATTLLDAGTRS